MTNINKEAEMGFFSKLRNPTQTTDNKLARAVLVPSVFTMMSDGSADQIELLQLSNLCGFSPIFVGISPEETIDMVKELIGEFKGCDFQGMIDRTTAELSMPMRETALVFAIRIALADGKFEESERQTLIMLAKSLGIPPEKFNPMFEVMAILQRAPQSA